MTALPTGPLAGIRVVDLTQVVMGPYATQMMADMGADVIKIEPPAGDDMRQSSPGPVPGMGGVFANVNRGKRSVTLDLRSAQGKEALTRLIATADVFIHSMRGKAIARLGFDYAAVRAINPRIVYTNCYGYGRRGPDADKPAYDDTIQAECGIARLQEVATGEPGFVATIMADKVGGLTALYATVMALFHRERTGEGQEIEVPMFETMAAFMLVEHANGAIFTPPLTPARYQRVATPERRPYRTKDGHVAALVYNDRQWASFIAAVEPEWAGPELATLAQRAQHVDRIYRLLGETFLTRTTAEWLALLTEIGVPAAPLRSTDELFTNAHLEAVGFFAPVATPHGPVRFPGIPVGFSASPGAIRAGAPEAGEHTREVLRELGLGDGS